VTSPTHRVTPTLLEEFGIVFSKPLFLCLVAGYAAQTAMLIGEYWFFLVLVVLCCVVCVHMCVAIVVWGLVCPYFQQAILLNSQHACLLNWGNGLPPPPSSVCPLTHIILQPFPPRPEHLRLGVHDGARLLQHRERVEHHIRSLDMRQRYRVYTPWWYR